MESTQNVTRLLEQWRAGSKVAEAKLVEFVYPELRKIALRHLRAERSGHTLQPTALVNEAYLQLAAQFDKDWKNRSHFYAVAAQVMRRILVDYARHKKAVKRDGQLKRVELTDELVISDERLVEILSINEALEKLAAFDVRRCRVVELRFFGGLTENEIAEVLQVAPRTVKRDWEFAKAWLYGELHHPTESLS